MITLYGILTLVLNVVSIIGLGQLLALYSTGSDKNNKGRVQFYLRLIVNSSYSEMMPILLAEA